MSKTFDRNIQHLIKNIILTSIVSTILFFIMPFLALIVGAIGYIFSFHHYLKKRSQGIQELIHFLQRLNRGDYHYNLEAYHEGELQTLQAELHKTMILLKNANFELTQQKKYLQKSLEDISHQLKTPITSLSILNELQDEQDPLVIKSNMQINRLNTLTQSLLYMTKLDAKLIEFKLHKTSTQTLIEDLLAMNMPALNHANLEVIVNDSNFPIICDPHYTLEALHNVLNNKLFYANSVITIETEYTGLRTLIKISDDGETINDIDRDHLFERFYSGSNKRPDSIGIGLAIALETMKQQNASIFIEGNNTFVFSFSQNPNL